MPPISDAPPGSYTLKGQSWYKAAAAHIFGLCESTACPYMPRPAPSRSKGLSHLSAKGARGQHTPPRKNWSRGPGVSIPAPSMGAPQWSTTNVAYLTAVAVASCMVGYSGTVYLNTPVSTTLQAMQGL